MKSKSQLLIALLLSLVLVLGACSGGDSTDTTESTDTTAADPGTTESPSETDGTDTTAAATGDTSEANGGESGDNTQSFTIANPAEPPSLDMTTQTGTVLAQLLLYNTMEPLVQIDDNGQVQPLLAESWEVSDDGLTYTFTIHDGVTFHDGSPLTIEDVVFTFTHGRDFEGHVNGDAFEIVDTVEAIDSNTVEVTLTKPDSTFLKRMGMRSGVIVAERHLEDMASSPIGTGPFAFSEWNRGESIIMERFDNYWGDSPALETVEWVFIDDENSAVNALLAGDVDAISEVNAADRIQELEEAEDVTVVSAAGDNISVFHINHEVEPFDNIRIRQALAYAIDEQAILDGWSPGYGETTAVMAALQDPYFDDYDPYPYDPEEARSILQEEGQEGLELEIAAVNDDISLPQAEIIMAQLFDAGFNPTLVSYDLATLLETVIGGSNFETSPIGVKSARVTRMTCEVDWFQNYCNPEYDALLEEALTATEPEEINAAFQEAVHFLADDVATIPFIARVNVGAHRNNVSGWRASNPDSVMDLRPLELQP